MKEDKSFYLKLENVGKSNIDRLSMISKQTTSIETDIEVFDRRSFVDRLSDIQDNLD